MVTAAQSPYTSIKITRTLKEDLDKIRKTRYGKQSYTLVIAELLTGSRGPSVKRESQK